MHSQLQCVRKSYRRLIPTIPWKNECTHETPAQESRKLNHNLNQGPPEYEARMLPNLPWYSFSRFNKPTAVLGSSPMTAKQPWARSVLRCVTVWEQTVLLASVGTAICYRLMGTRDSISENRRLCWMRKREGMHKRSENGTGVGIAATVLYLNTFKHRRIQRHIQSNMFKRQASTIGKWELLSFENVTPWTFVNCYQNCEISRVRRGVKEVFALLGCYIMYVGRCMYLPTYSAQQPGSQNISYI